MDILASRSLQLCIRLGLFMLTVAALYWGRGLLVPLVLAALLAFMLGPLVKKLCRRRLPRPLAVLMVCLVVFSSFGVVAWLLGREMHHLAFDLPAHRRTIQERVKAFQSMGENNLLARLRELARSLSEADAGPEAAGFGAAPAPKPAGVSRPLTDNGLLARGLNLMLATLADAVGTAGLVVLFVVFILLRQEDIEHRFVRLIGYSRLTVTTKALDEAARRISRYLLTQFGINAIHGLLLAGGLACIGLPYTVLWGVLAALFRFIPYLGPWMVAVLPVSLSLAVFDGWSQPLQVIALIATLELATNMLVEPVLFGQSAGVSDFSLLMAVMFWAWLWGGIGLLVATPLTVCLVVFCKHVPALGWVDILMGDKVASQAHLHLYQRILADDETASLELIQRLGREQGVARALDQAMLPALALARREAALGRLETAEESAFYHSLRAAASLLKDSGEESAGATPARDTSKARVLARALHGEADQLALELLAQALGGGARIAISTAPQLISEWIDLVEKVNPALVCISAMPPGAQLAAAVLCRRLRARLPSLRILVCHWLLPQQERDPRVLKDAGANWVTGCLAGTVEIIRRELH